MTTTRRAFIPAQAEDKDLQADFGTGVLFTVQEHVRPSYFQCRVPQACKGHAVRHLSAVRPSVQPQRWPDTLRPNMQWIHQRKPLTVGRRDARDLFKLDAVKSTDRHTTRTRAPIFWNSPTIKQAPIAANEVNCQAPIKQGFDQ